MFAIRTMMTALAGMLALVAGFPAGAATQLVTSEVVAANAEAAAQLPQAREFTLSAAGTYTVTLEDLGVPLPLRDVDDLDVAPLQSLRALITRDLETVAVLEIEYPTTPNQRQQPDTASFAGTPGTYRVHVLGAIATGETGGLYSLAVAPAGGGAAVFQASDAIATTSGPAPEQFVFSTTLTISATGTYRVRALDRGFPAALATRDVLLLRTVPTVGVAVDSRGQPFSTADVGTFNAIAGEKYDLIVIANAGASTAGLYGVSVQGGPADEVIFSRENAVGLLPPARELNIAAAGNHTLTLVDLEFPEVLQSFSAAVIQNGAFVGSATGGTPATLALNAGAAELFVYATAATTGALSTRLVRGAQTAYADVHITDASPDVTTPTIYSFKAPQAVSAGGYTLTVEDLRFPSPLVGIHAAVVQGATVVHEMDAAGSQPVTLQSGGVRVLVAVTPPAPSGTTPGNGAFALALNAQAGNASVLESTQGVGGLFTAIALNVPVSGRYDVSLKDFEFPARLRTSWLAITRGATTVGQVIGSTSIQNLQLEAGMHVLNFLGQPAASSSYGTFGVKVSDSTPAPVVTLTASPASVTSGQSTTLTWSATNATSCSASGGWSGTKAVSGSESSGALTSNSTFGIECVGPGGRGNASAAVSINAAAPRKSGGGGHVDPVLIIALLGMLAASTLNRRRRAGDL